MLEGSGAELAHAQAVGDGTRDPLGWELDQLTAPQALPGVGRKLGFHPDHAHLRARQLDRGRDAADKSPAAYRNQHRLDVGQIFEYLEPHGALAGHERLVVVGRDGHVAVLGGELLGLSHPLRAVVADEEDLGTEGRRGVHLDPRRAARHDDDGPHAQGAGREGDGLGVVAARVGDHPAATFVRERGRRSCCRRRAA